MIPRLRILPSLLRSSPAASSSLCVGVWLCVVGSPARAIAAPDDPPTAETSARPKPPTTPPGYPVQGATRFDTSVAAAIEVKRVPAGLLLVKPRVNGHDAGWFIFDTGAGIGVISTPHVEGLDLRADGKITAVGVGAQQADILRADTFVLGAVVLADLPMIALDLSFLKPHLGEEIAGIVGYGLLSQCVTEIDLSTPSLALHDPATYEREDLPWSTATFDTFIPVVNGRFDGNEGKFTLDTGANDGLSFHAHAVKEYDLLANRETTDSKLGGVGGTIATKRGRIGRLELCGLTLEDHDATFEVESKSGESGGTVGNVGVGILKQRVLVTDYSRGRVAFAPRETDVEVEVDGGGDGDRKSKNGR